MKQQIVDLLYEEYRGALNIKAPGERQVRQTEEKKRDKYPESVLFLHY